MLIVASIVVIGEELRKARQTMGLSQEEVAFRSGLSRNYVSLVELNQKSPTFDTLLRICAAIGIKTWVLVKRIETYRQGS